MKTSCLVFATVRDFEHSERIGDRVAAHLVHQSGLPVPWLLSNIIKQVFTSITL